MVLSRVIPNGTYFTRRTLLEQEGEYHEHAYHLDTEMEPDSQRL
jgi:hypothetical protein